MNINNVVNKNIKQDEYATSILEELRKAGNNTDRKFAVETYGLNRHIEGIGVIYPSRFNMPETLILQKLIIDMGNKTISCNGVVSKIDSINDWDNGEMTIYTQYYVIFLVIWTDNLNNDIKCDANKNYRYDYICSMVGTPISYKSLVHINNWMNSYHKGYAKMVSRPEDQQQVISYFLIKYLYEEEHKSYEDIGILLGCEKSTIFRSYKERRPLGKINSQNVDINSDFAKIIANMYYTDRIVEGED